MADKHPEVATKAPGEADVRVVSGNYGGYTVVITETAFGQSRRLASVNEILTGLAWCGHSHRTRAAADHCADGWRRNWRERRRVPDVQ